jgi:Mrp family chromosome partitioning ATPase
MNIVAPLQERRDFNSMVKDDLSKSSEKMLKTTSTAATADAHTEEMGPDENFKPLSAVKAETRKSAFYNENKELAPLSKKLSKLEDQLYCYLFQNLSQEEMSGVNKFILVPIGLPGLGKSTLSRFLSATSQDYFNEQLNHHSQKQSCPEIDNFKKRA